MVLELSLAGRTEQLIFFLGFAYQGRQDSLLEAIQWYKHRGYNICSFDNVFLEQPYNDSLDQIIKSYHISKNSKKPSFTLLLIDLLSEFIFLVSDFAPPCCGDGRTFYCEAANRHIYLECDRCGQIYDLDTRVVEVRECKKMTKNDFLYYLDISTSSNWPYHLRLKEYLCA